MKYFLLIALLSSSAYAGDNCKNISNSLQEYNCSFIEKDKSTAILNKKYQQFIDNIKQNYQASQSLSDKLIFKLEASQQTWQAYMTATCKVYAFSIDEDNRNYASTINHCITDLTNKRIMELNELMNNV